MIELRTGLAAVLALAIASCSSAPPKPPEVDESGRHPANSKSAVQLQTCAGELDDARTELLDARKLADSSSAALAQATVEELRCRIPPAVAVAPAAPPARTAAAGNVVWTLRFAFNSARIDASAEELARLLAAARAAAYVVVKGRTDGTVETPGESAIARRRVAAMYGVLLQGGVDPHRIALQYQPVGDRIADNTTLEGQAANRRAEIELYPVAPERLDVHGGAAIATPRVLATTVM